MTDPTQTADSTDAPAESGADPAVGSSAEVGDDETAAKETILEMRQVAGLTAGSIMGLHRGSFQFRESEKEVGFSLMVREPDEVLVIAGSAPAMVDEIPVRETTPLGEAVLNVGSACFTVRPPRAEPDRIALTAQLEAARQPPKAIEVPELSTTEQGGGQVRSSRFGSLFSRQDDDGDQTVLDQDSWRFLESIRDLRSLVAERHRSLHPNPEELRSRLERLDPGLWDRTVEHPLFARFAVAFSTIPWEPRFDNPELIPEPLHGPIQEMSRLPWVPITANLLYGPLGIVGTRSAVLACARNAVLSLACLTAPADIEFSIVTAQGLVEDWNWTSSLPNSLFPTGRNNYCVAVADGMAHFEGAGFDHEAVKRNEMGLIVLGESVDELPDYCGTILRITPEGQCQVTNHLGEQVLGTPIGISAEFASTTAALVKDAIGDDLPPGTISAELFIEQTEAVIGSSPSESEDGDELTSNFHEWDSGVADEVDSLSEGALTVDEALADDLDDPDDADGQDHVDDDGFAISYADDSAIDPPELPESNAESDSDSAPDSDSVLEPDADYVGEGEGDGHPELLEEPELSMPVEVDDDLSDESELDLGEESRDADS